jgi:hypothetical protein
MVLLVLQFLLQKSLQTTETTHNWINIFVEPKVLIHHRKTTHQLNDHFLLKYH